MFFISFLMRSLVAIGGLVLVAGVTPALAQDSGVCARTNQVGAAIVAATGATNCSYVTAAQLRDITSLDLGNRGLVTLLDGDFEGLVRLESLDLSDNQITGLPQGLFDPLISLRSLSLDNNSLSSLPSGIFDELLLLDTLTLHDNPSLTALPAGMFDDLSRFKGLLGDGKMTGKRRLTQFLKQHGITSVESFIEALPALHKERFVFVYRSEGLGAEFVTPDKPRVISWGADGQFIFSWTTNPDAPEKFRESVEFLIPGNAEWMAGVIDFTTSELRITHPEVCQTCHGPKNKPLFDGYLWNNSENLGTDPVFRSPALDERNMVALRASTSGRIAPLDLESSEYPGGGVRRLKPAPGLLHYVSPSEEFSTAAAMRHGEVLFARLKADDDYAQFAENYICQPLDRELVAGAGIAHFRTRFKPNNEYTLGMFGHTNETLSDSFDTNVKVQYDFRIGTLPGVMRLLVLYDLWKTGPDIRALYRQTSNTDAVALSGPRTDNVFNLEGFLFYPPGQASAEDELLQLYRHYFGYRNRASMHALDRANPWQYQTGQATADFEAAHTNRMSPRVCSAVKTKRLNQDRPHNLTASVSNGRVLLSWDAPDNSTGITAYRILRGADADSLEALVSSTGTTATTYTDTSATTDNTYAYSVVALRGEQAAGQSPSVQVALVAGPPVITSGSAFTVTEGDTAVATLTATDADTAAADLVWSIPSGTDGGADANHFTLTRGGVLAFTEAKDFEAPDDSGADGGYRVTVQVSDGSLTDTADLTVALANRNEAPAAQAGADQEDIEPGATVTLDGAGTDPDAGDTLGYAWTQTGGTTVTLSAAASATATFTAPDDLAADASLTFSLRVTDADGLYDEDTVTVTVSAPEQAALTAKFLYVPDSHDGATDFTVNLNFSEEISGVSFSHFVNGLLTVRGGTVASANRLNPPSNLDWQVRITPSGSGDVVVTLPANRACDATPTVCTAGGQRLSQPATVTIAHSNDDDTESTTPLTAEFIDVPASHDGSGDFTVTLSFKKEVSGLSYRDFIRGLLSVRGGFVVRAKRLNPPSNLNWQVRITPTGSGRVTITLPANRACDARPTVCTEGGERLSAPATVTVPGS